MEGTITEDRVLGRFAKSTSAEIQVSLVDWQGQTYLDLREVLPNDTGGVTFTKKGVRLRADLVGQLLDLLHQVPPQ